MERNLRKAKLWLCCFKFFLPFRLSLLISLLIFSSCVGHRNLVYFSDLKTTGEYANKIENNFDPKIQPNDLLGITVNSLNPESNALFNTVISQTISNPISTVSYAGPTNKLPTEGYLVDNMGFINFPVIGRIQVGGLTKAEATEKLARELDNHVKQPIVNLRFLNFKVTVIGEVSRPSSFTLPTEKINVLEALGLAGDMTPYGKRENVLIIREKDGVRSATRINLNNKDILNSPYFYLQQNDIIYVEPENKAKVAQTDPSYKFIPILVATISAMAILTSAILRN